MGIHAQLYIKKSQMQFRKVWTSALGGTTGILFYTTVGFLSVKFISELAVLLSQKLESMLDQKQTVESLIRNDTA